MPKGDASIMLTLAKTPILMCKSHIEKLPDLSNFAIAKNSCSYTKEGCKFSAATYWRLMELRISPLIFMENA